MSTCIEYLQMKYHLNPLHSCCNQHNANLTLFVSFPFLVYAVSIVTVGCLWIISLFVVILMALVSPAYDHSRWGKNCDPMWLKSRLIVRKRRAYPSVMFCWLVRVNLVLLAFVPKFWEVVGKYKWYFLILWVKVQWWWYHEVIGTLNPYLVQKN